MPTIRRPRLLKAGVLKDMKPTSLVALLSPHAGYFRSREIFIEQVGEPDFDFATLAAVLAWALLAPRSYRLYRSTAVAALRLTFAARMLLVDSTRLFVDTAPGAHLPPLAESVHFLFTLAVASGVLLLDQVCGAVWWVGAGIRSIETRHTSICLC